MTKNVYVITSTQLHFNYAKEQTKLKYLGFSEDF